MTEWDPRSKSHDRQDPVITDHDPNAEFTQDYVDPHTEHLTQSEYAPEEFPTQRVGEHGEVAEPVLYEEEVTVERPDKLRRALTIGIVSVVLVGGAGVLAKYFAGKRTESEPVATAPANPGQTEPAAAETTTTQPETKSEEDANINLLTPVEMGGKVSVLEDARDRAFVPQKEAPTAKAAANEVDSVYNNFARMKSANELTGDALIKQNQAILNKMFEGRNDIDPKSKQLLLDLNKAYSKDGVYPDFKLSGGTFDAATGTLSNATMKVTKYKRDASGFEEPVDSFSYTFTETVELDPVTKFWNFDVKSFPNK